MNAGGMGMGMGVQGVGVDAMMLARAELSRQQEHAVAHQVGWRHCWPCCHVGRVVVLIARLSAPPPLSPPLPVCLPRCFVQVTQASLAAYQRQMSGIGNPGGKEN